MLKFEVKRGVSGIRLAVLAAIFVAAFASCTTRSASLQQPPAPTPVVQTEQSVELLSPLELLKSGSATPGRFNTGDISTSVLSSRVYGTGFRPFDPSASGKLQYQAFAAYALNLAGFDGPYDLTTQWQGGFGDYNELWVGLSDWENNTWSWSATDEGFVDGEIVAQHISSEGELLVVLVVGGMEERVLDWLRVGPDFLPTASIMTEDIFGFSPMTIEFSAAGSEDLEGALEYAWDETGDGEFIEFGASYLHEVVITETQTLRSRVRVRDSANQTADAELEQFVEVLSPPTMSLECDWEANHPYGFQGVGLFEAPYFLDESEEGETIHFSVTDQLDGSGSPIDPADLNWTLQWISSYWIDQAIKELGLRYQNGFGVGAEGFSWTNPGELLIGNRGWLIGAVAYDDEYNTTEMIYFLSGNQDGYEVVLCFNASKTTGDYPLRVDFDHSMSYITDHEVESVYGVSLDFNGDGEIDCISDFYGDHELPGTSYVFHAPGNYTVVARPVNHENEPLLQESFTQEITVTDGGGPKWHFTRVPLPENLVTDEISRSESIDLVEIQGKPAFCTSTDDDDQVDQHFILRARDNLGISWESTATILPVGDIRDLTFEVIGGNPVLLVQENGLSYMQALDPSGTTWDTPVNIYDGYPYVDDLVLADINGSAGVAFTVWRRPGHEVVYVGFDGVTAPNGWFSEILYSTNDFIYSEGIALCEVSDQPAVVYKEVNVMTGEDELRFARALDGVGHTWGSSIVIDSEGAGVRGAKPSLAMINGLPAVCYLTWAEQSQALGFSMGTSPSGSNWTTPSNINTVISDYYGFNTWMFEHHNRPWVFTNEAVPWHGEKMLRMWVAEDGEGTFWQEPSPVFSTNFSTVDTAIIDGKPAMVMVRYQWDEVAQAEVQELRFGMLY